MFTATRLLVVKLGGIGILLTSCGVAQSPYPLDEGTRWEYEVTSKTRYGDRSMQMTISTLPERTLDGHIVNPIRHEVGGRTSFRYIGQGTDGFYEVGKQDSSDPEPEIHEHPRYFLKRPLRVGHTWTAESQTEIVERGTPVMLTFEIVSMAETVTVTAGTFENCVKVVTTGQAVKEMGAMALDTTASLRVEGVDWYAPGVGLVRGFYQEASDHLLAAGGELSLQLRRGPWRESD